MSFKDLYRRDDPLAECLSLGVFFFCSAGRSGDKVGVLLALSSSILFEMGSMYFLISYWKRRFPEALSFGWSLVIGVCLSVMATPPPFGVLVSIWNLFLDRDRDMFLLWFFSYLGAISSSFKSP